jgi:hypothetical protein
MSRLKKMTIQAAVVAAFTFTPSAAQVDGYRGHSPRKTRSAKGKQKAAKALKANKMKDNIKVSVTGDVNWDGIKVSKPELI